MKSSKKFHFGVNTIFIVVTFIFIVIVCFVKSSAGAEYKIVETKDGKVRGVRDTTLIKKVDFDSFKGIPYAENPIGELRYKAPEPVKSWAPIILNATEFGSTCTQISLLAPENPLQQSENCLFLNVYVPADIESDEKLAVLVYIHGGAFTEGSGNDDMFGPDFLIEQRVILVTLNYRLGIFGFISFETPEYSGNMALKDQQLALKWVQANIKQFSGDNKRITLFGESAGGVLSHVQILSSESRKYFRNAILLSGTAESDWGFASKNGHRSIAHEIARDLGKPQDSMQSLINFFKTVPAESIVKYASAASLFTKTPVTTWAPILERGDAIHPFIVEYPKAIYNKSNIDVDTMFALCSLESMMLYNEKFEDCYDLKGFDRNFSITFPFRGADLPFDSTEYKKLAAEVRYFYFKDAAIDVQTLKPYISLLSDVFFAYGVDKGAKLHAKKSAAKTFYYRFSVDSKFNAIKRWHGGGPGFAGAGHADDLCYIFRCRNAQPFYDEALSTPDDEQSKISLRAVENITKLFANFAKYGEPTYQQEPIAGFLPIDDDQVNFLDVTNDGLMPGVNPNQKAMEFWAHVEREVQEIQAKSKQFVHEEL
ncbi:esterase B1-like [Sitodiplosis mosellana]|uniref:esterase B1-like n=1 Tax=Sitodiplosis mosellana TaxID=263140 RepID=UPI002443EA20|nr:esterase B1-like [Sitodiplosis mosellana]